METFGENISAEACSGKEIAGLLKKMMMRFHSCRPYIERLYRLSDTGICKST